MDENEESRRRGDAEAALEDGQAARATVEKPSNMKEVRQEPCLPDEVEIRRQELANAFGRFVGGMNDCSVTISFKRWNETDTCDVRVSHAGVCRFNTKGHRLRLANASRDEFLRLAERLFVSAYLRIEGSVRIPSSRRNVEG